MARRTDFGAFYPTGYIVAAFEKYENAQQTRQDLLTDGYEERDCALHTAQEVAEAAQRNIEDTGLTVRLGKSMAAIKEHLEAARVGATFLLIYAPKELDAERVMNVISRRPHVLAHCYHRFAIEDLAPEESGTLRVTSPR